MSWESRGWKFHKDRPVPTLRTLAKFAALPADIKREMLECALNAEYIFCSNIRRLDDNDHIRDPLGSVNYNRYVNLFFEHVDDNKELQCTALYWDLVENVT